MAPLTQAQLAERGAAFVANELQEQLDALYKQFPNLKTAQMTAKRKLTLAIKKGGAAGVPKIPKPGALTKEEVMAKRHATMLARYGTTDLKQIAQIKKAQKAAETTTAAAASAAMTSGKASGTVSGAAQTGGGDAIDVADEAKEPEPAGVA